MNKFLVVTGGAGFVGSNLIKLLINKTNYKIISIDDYSSGKKNNHINIFHRWNGCYIFRTLIMHKHCLQPNLYKMAKRQLINKTQCFSRESTANA